MSIDHDDNDLIFISGGIEKSEYNCNDIFLILKNSKKSIEYNGNLQERKIISFKLCIMIINYI
jgi:hypothetical protein